MILACFAGSISSGLISEFIGMSTTMGMNAGFLAAALTWFGLRSSVSNKGTTSPSSGRGSGDSAENWKRKRKVPRNYFS